MASGRTLLHVDRSAGRHNNDDSTPRESIPRTAYGAMLAAVTPVHVHFRPLRYVPVLIDLQVGKTCLCDSYRGISTMRRRAAKVCAIAVSISVCTATAFADTDTCAASLQLQEILITAQKRAENPQDTPISIQAYSAEAIEILGSKSSTDLGQTLPNLQISPASGAGNQPVISIRGIGLNTVWSAKYQSGGTDSFTPMQPLWAFGVGS
jgi:TonB-dependent receptor-like protein